MSDISPQAEHDVHRPPEVPRKVRCRLCREEYQSYDLKWDPARQVWRCPTPACAGVGYGQDIRSVESDDLENDDHPVLGEAGDDLNEELWNIDDDAEDEFTEADEDIDELD